MTAAILCPACSAAWSDDSFTPGCPTCGGGALRRDCPICDGACGEAWVRAVDDSIDANAAHWLGACAYEWWIDEPALPEIRWARLRREGESLVIECANLFFGFATIDEALCWLGEEEYIPYRDALAGGLIPPETLPPQASP